MSILIRGFITRDDFVTPRNQDVSPIYELSETSITYAKRKQIVYPPALPTYCFTAFDSFDTATDIDVPVSESTAESIIRLVTELGNYLTINVTVSKPQAIINFTAMYNVMFPNATITDLAFNEAVSIRSIKVPDYVTFKMGDKDISVWTSDVLFQTFYPNFDINVVFPFDRFENIVQNNAEMLAALAEVDPVTINQRLDNDRYGNPPTVSRVINIPYQVPNSTLTRNCYFGFNVYGRQGNYDYILKLELYRVLTQVYGIPGRTVEELFPTILRINEFFFIPRWERFAIPTQIGRNGINSQLSSTFIENYDIGKYLKVLNDTNFIRNNTYDFPVNYNNLLVQVVNSSYSEPRIRDFYSYYSDYIAVNSMHPDFGAMSQRTQRFVVMLNNMLAVANSQSQTELFNKTIANNDYQFNIIDRSGVTYISIYHEDHQYYVIPKYEFFRLQQGQ